MEQFKSQMPLNTPVLFLVFNRPDTTEKVFAEIKKAKPPKLYLAADGARNKKEEEKVKEVKDIVINNIDWPCELKTLFRDNNLGCKYAVSSAIDWFFDNEEMGIILEDDCLPAHSFFWFCEELLNKYKDDMRVGLISGNNNQKGIKRGDSDYYFSIYNHVWGWASWANRWQSYDVELSNINNIDFIEDIFQEKQTKKYWLTVFDAMKRNTIDTWDYQFTFIAWHKGWLSIIPNVNLIKNIGFGDDATHTKAEGEHPDLEIHDIVLKNHPQEVCRDLEADFFTSKFVFRVFYKERIITKINIYLHKAKKLFRSILPNET